MKTRTLINSMSGRNSIRQDSIVPKLSQIEENQLRHLITLAEVNETQEMALVAGRINIAKSQQTLGK